uniref:Potassium transporter n=1 Tax=Ananas comosus var. bracteatus TaxID=296719 RepID=A0A6V7PSP2_ANACO|nr:unnamed protein product [Ananas comosus var. bracteatus]
MGTSPLYVYAGTFPDGITVDDDLYGVLSLIIYTLLLLSLLKYVFIVLWANDNGDGGTFALYSLISRYAKVSLIPNQQAEDAMVSNYKLQTPSTRMRRAQWMKQKLEGSVRVQVALFIITILATSMVIGDGVLTPCISGKIVIISIVILLLLFAIQRLGTDKVGYSFAPIIFIWFLLIGGIGIYNLFKYDVGVLRAFNPKYIVDYFKRNGKQGWISLGGVILCITGTEAMFADLGHFNIRAIQISFSFLLLPSVSLAYIGQAAYLTKYPANVGDTFYKSIPGPLFWPTFIVAVAASIIASQAMISGAFAIIWQSQSLGCFPRVKVMHTSAKYEGQVYIPEINFVLAVACVIVTAVFRTTVRIGNAYGKILYSNLAGIAVVFVMTITTFMVTLIMLLIWQTSIWWITLFVVVFGGVELVYLSSVLYKFVQGGYLPLAFAFILMMMMGIWHYVHVKKYKFELHNIVSSDYIRELAQKQTLRRIPGIGLLYSELVQGVPPIFSHFTEKIPSIHSVVVIVSIKQLPIPHVEIAERYLFRQVEPSDFRLYRCVVRYGYIDALEEPKVFERSLIQQLKNYIEEENILRKSDAPRQSEVQLEELNDNTKPRSGSSTVHIEETLEQNILSNETHSSERISIEKSHKIEEEKQIIEKELEKGVVYLVGEADVMAKQDSSILKKIIVNYIYNFMRRNSRQGDRVLMIPRDKLLKVGMTYEI